MNEQEKAKKYDELKRKEKRYTIRQKLMLKKAQEKGLVVTEAEIDAELKRLS